MRRRENLPVSLQPPLADLYHSCVRRRSFCAAAVCGWWCCHGQRWKRVVDRLLRRRRRGCSLSSSTADVRCSQTSATAAPVVRCHRVRRVLSTASGGAASGDPVSGGRRSYKRPASLLQAPGGAAIFLQWRCYIPPAALLQWCGGATTMARAALQLSGGLHSSGGAARVLRRRCYSCPAASVDATRG
jgi:hypothetical protein